MELRLLGAGGIRKGSLLAVKVGGRRTFLPYDEETFAKGPCRFPGLNGPQQVKLDVYEHVAQARLIAEPTEARWSVALLPPEALDGDLSGGPAGAHASADANISIELEMCGATAASAKDLPEEGGAGDKKHRQEAMLAAKSQPYFEQHNLMQVMQTLLQSVIKEMPTDPYAYMIQVLQNSNRCATASSASKKPRPQTASACRRPQSATLRTTSQKSRPRSAVARTTSFAPDAKPEAPVHQSAVAAAAGAAAAALARSAGEALDAASPVASSCGLPTLCRRPPLPGAPGAQQQSPLPAMISPRKPSAPISPAGQGLKQVSPRGLRSAPRLGGPPLGATGGATMRPCPSPSELPPTPGCGLASPARPAKHASPERRRWEDGPSLPRPSSSHGPLQGSALAERRVWKDGIDQSSAAPAGRSHSVGGLKAPAAPSALGGSPQRAPPSPTGSPQRGFIARTAGRLPAHVQSAPSLRTPRLSPPAEQQAHCAGAVAVPATGSSALVVAGGAGAGEAPLGEADEGAGGPSARSCAGKEDTFAAGSDAGDAQNRLEREAALQERLSWALARRDERIEGLRGQLAGLSERLEQERAARESLAAERLEREAVQSASREELVSELARRDELAKGLRGQLDSLAEGLEQERAAREALAAELLRRQKGELEEAVVDCQASPVCTRKEQKALAVSQGARDARSPCAAGTDAAARGAPAAAAGQGGEEPLSDLDLYSLRALLVHLADLDKPHLPPGHILSMAPLATPTAS